MFNVFINLTFGYNFSWSLEHTLDLSLFNDWWKHTTSDKFILQIEWDCNFRQTWLNISSKFWRNLLRKLMTHLGETDQPSFCCRVHSFALCGDKTHLWWHVHNPSPPWARSPMKEKTKTEYKIEHNWTWSLLREISVQNLEYLFSSSLARISWWGEMELLTSPPRSHPIFHPDNLPRCRRD